MACKYVCDGCGKEQAAVPVPETGLWIKPHSWYERSDDDGIQTACCRECIEKIAEKTGKTSVVFPI